MERIEPIDWSPAKDRSSQASLGSHGRQAEHDEDDDRPQAAAARANQRAEAAGADQRHAEAEGQAADDGACPAEIRGQVEALLQFDQPGKGKRLRQQ